MGKSLGEFKKNQVSDNELKFLAARFLLKARFLVKWSMGGYVHVFCFVCLLQRFVHHQ